MRDYKGYISTETVGNIHRYFANNGYNMEIFEGSLHDNYLIEVGESRLKLGGIQLRKYLIINEVYRNEWSSAIELIATDNEKLFREYETLFTEESA